MQAFVNIDDSMRSVSGRIEGIPEGGVLTVWKIQTNTKDGKASYHIVHIGISPSGKRAPWLERLGEKILNMEPMDQSNIPDWYSLATNNKQQCQALLHRELLFSGIISEEMTYSATLLALFGITT